MTKPNEGSWNLRVETDDAHFEADLDAAVAVVGYELSRGKRGAWVKPRKGSVMATTKKKAPTKRVSRVATAEKAPAGATAWKVRIRTNEAHFVHDIDAAESADAPAEQLDALKFALRRALSSGAFPGPAWVLELHGDADSLGFSIKVA